MFFDGPKWWYEINKIKNCATEYSTYYYQTIIMALVSVLSWFLKMHPLLAFIHLLSCFLLSLSTRIALIITIKFKLTPVYLAIR